MCICASKKRWAKQIAQKLCIQKRGGQNKSHKKTMKYIRHSLKCSLRVFFQTNKITVQASCVSLATRLVGPSLGEVGEGIQYSHGGVIYRIDQRRVLTRRYFVQGGGGGGAFILYSVVEGNEGIVSHLSPVRGLHLIWHLPFFLQSVIHTRLSRVGNQYLLLALSRISLAHAQHPSPHR